MYMPYQRGVSHQYGQSYKPSESAGANATIHLVVNIDGKDLA